MDSRYTLCASGVPLDGLFTWRQPVGDNISNYHPFSIGIPHLQLGKRPNALSYHRAREAVALKILCFCKIDGKQNPSDVLTKYWPYAVIWPLVQPFLLWGG
jgi:hypothetical protein